MAETLRFKNEREFMRALKDVDADAAKELRRAARTAAQPVAAEAQRLAARFGGLTASGIRPGSRHGIGVVRQTRRKTTGYHPEFGPLLMRRSLLPALAEKDGTVVLAMEAALDRALRKFNQGR